jgi:hypothetical protein
MQVAFHRLRRSGGNHVNARVQEIADVPFRDAQLLNTCRVVEADLGVAGDTPVFAL